MTESTRKCWTAQSLQTAKILARYFSQMNMALTLIQIRSTKSLFIKIQVHRNLRNILKIMKNVATYEDQVPILIQVPSFDKNWKQAQNTQYLKVTVIYHRNIL